MWISKLTMLAVVFLAVGLAGTGLAVLAFQQLGHQAAAVPAPENPRQPAAREPEGGKPVNGLKLTLSADKTETVMKADGSNAEPVKLKMTFTNVSDKPIKLDAYDLLVQHMPIEVTAPDGQSLKIAGSSRFLVGDFQSFGSMQVRIFRRR